MIINYYKKCKISLIIIILSFLLITVSCSSGSGDIVKNEEKKSYSHSNNLTEKYEYLIPATSIKNQNNTGTCWSYNTISFIESEVIRKGIADESLNLSEMYIVYHTYIEKSKKYLETFGKNSFGEGGEDYDTIMIIDKYGIVREGDYNVINKHYHSYILSDIYEALDRTLRVYEDKKS
ncbi:MAG: C1 family peptidase, partial [bacterium]